MKESAVISAAVEGPVDEAVVRKLIVHVGGIAGTICGKNGKANLRQRIRGFNHAAHYSPWIVLVDLNSDAECAPPLCREWLPDLAPHLCFRVAVKEVEAWLMADIESMASFLSIARAKIPADPEDLLDPKTMMVNMARRSRRWAVRADMVPREGSGRPVGPAYTSRLIEFVQNRWRPDIAAERAASLHRAISCLRRLVAKTSSI